MANAGSRLALTLWRPWSGAIFSGFRLERAVDEYRQSVTPDPTRFIDRPDLNWRTLLLDVPLFELSAAARGLIYRLLTQVRALGAAGKRLDPWILHGGRRATSPILALTKANVITGGE